MSEQFVDCVSLVGIADGVIFTQDAINTLAAKNPYFSVDGDKLYQRHQVPLKYFLDHRDSISMECSFKNN